MSRRNYMTVTRRVLAVALLTALAGVTRIQAQSASVSGTWTGNYYTSESDGTIELVFEEVEGEWTLQVVTTSVEHPSTQPDPASDVVVEGSKVAFTIQWGTPIRWTGEIDGDTIVGRLQADHWGGDWEVKRAGS